MTQRVFDVDNEKDMQDLWDIVPDDSSYAKKTSDGATFYSFDGVPLYYSCELININWHDKTEITRPIQEATEADVDKLCKFWDEDGGETYGILAELIIECSDDRKYGCVYGRRWTHARRLTKQEIEELC